MQSNGPVNVQCSHAISYTTYVASWDSGSETEIPQWTCSISRVSVVQKQISFQTSLAALAKQRVRAIVTNQDLQISALALILLSMGREASSRSGTVS